MSRSYGYVSKSLTQALQWFVMGYYIEHIGNLMLIWKLHKQKSIYGVSIQSQICLLFATLGRCIWFTDTKLPSMYFAWIELGLALLLHSYIIFLCYKFKDSLYKEPPIYFKAVVLLTVASVLAILFHPGKKDEKYFLTQQMFVSFSMFAEALSLSS